MTFALGILDKKARNMKLRYQTSVSFTSFKAGSKLYNLSCAVMDEQLDENADFDINSLVGGTVQVLVKHTHNEERGVTYANIKEVLPAKDKLPVLTEEEKGSEHIDPNEDIKPSEVLIPEE